jgi:hypothetical protein
MSNRRGCFLGLTTFVAFAILLLLLMYKDAQPAPVCLVPEGWEVIVLIDQYDQTTDRAVAIIPIGENSVHATLAWCDDDGDEWQESTPPYISTLEAEELEAIFNVADEKFCNSRGIKQIVPADISTIGTAATGREYLAEGFLIRCEPQI